LGSLVYLDVTSGERHWRDVYQLCIGIVNPRPIALVSTRSADGQPNLAPFSFFNLVSANPPVLIVCPSFRRDGRPKHTLMNIRETREFVVAIVTAAIAPAVVRAAAELTREQDEFTFSGLTPAPARHVKPALVHESPVNIECRLRDIVQISDQPGGGSVIFGDLLALHVADWILGPSGRPDPRKLRTVGRLGGQGYCTVSDPYVLEIPSVGGE